MCFLLLFPVVPIAEYYVLPPTPQSSELYSPEFPVSYAVIMDWLLEL